MGGTSTSGQMPRDDNGQLLQKPYFFTTTDASGTTSPVVVSATAQLLVAPDRAVMLNLQTIGEPIWYRETATVTASGDYLATASCARIPVYPGAQIWLVEAAAADATVTTRWEILS